MKKRFLFFTVVLATFSLQAQQSFSGIRTSPYGGILSATANPANIVDGMRRGGFNLLAVDAQFSNNKMGLTTDLEKSFNDFTKFEGNPLLSQNDIDADVNLDVLGPSLFFHVGNRIAIGVTSRVRTFADARGIDAKILQSYLSDINQANILSYPNIQIDNQNVALNAFSEIGATFGMVLLKTDNHTLKVGATAKYVQGAISSYSGFTNFSGDASLRENNGDLILDLKGAGDFVIANGGVDLFGDIDFNDAMKSSATTLGFDLGAVYEYREECPSCFSTPYRFKLGVSVTDIGKLKYEHTDSSYRYRINTGVNTIAFDLSNLQQTLDLSTLVTKESTKGQSFTSSLPTALRIQADVRLLGMLYVDFSGQYSMVDDNIYNSKYANGFVITPRFEGRFLGLYVPVANTSGVGTTIGTALRLGPLFVGSSSVISNLMGDKAKALNVFCGLQFNW